MKLFTQDYLNIVVKAIELEHKDIVESFRLHYKAAKNDNPDFLLQLGKVIHEYSSYLNRSPDDTISFAENGGIKEINPLEKLSIISDVFNPNPTNIITLTKQKIEPIVAAFEKIEKQINEDEREPELLNDKKGKIHHTTQFLILKRLGVFDRPELQGLPLEEKGMFFSRLLNMNLDNAKDYITNINDKYGKSKKGPYNTNSIKQADELLKIIGVDFF